jgi:hypothetical protein
MASSSSAASSDQRQCTAEEGSVIGGWASGTDGLLLDLRVLVREHIVEVRVLYKGVVEGMKDGGRRWVQEYRAGGEATVGSFVDRTEQVDDEQPGATAAVEVCTAESQNGLRYPVCVTCWVEA